MTYFSRGSKSDVISPEEIRQALYGVFERLGTLHRVLAIPPDYTRLNSYAGPIVGMANDCFGERLTDVLPALGTHAPMEPWQIEDMFRGVPSGKFRLHDWRHGVSSIGIIPSEYVKEVSEGKLDYSLDVQLDKLLLDPSFDLILSVGQVVPHEVVGMANHSKNIFIGCGGADFINKSHYIGSTYGIERTLGRADTPVRAVFEYARTHFAKALPIVYVLTVRDKDPLTGQVVTRGLYIGDDCDCFRQAASLSLECNFVMVSEPLQKCVVYLDPAEFRSTWLGNKAIYRTRMAIADGGELIILAPGLKEFGEDKQIDTMIRKYGYKGTPHTLECTRENADLRSNLGASAHLIHGSSEGRFAITYCPGPAISREEIEGVGFKYCPYDEMARRYPPERLRDGVNTMPDGEQIYYISNPALALWAHPDRFKN